MDCLRMYHSWTLGLFDDQFGESGSMVHFAIKREPIPGPTTVPNHDLGRGEDDLN